MIEEIKIFKIKSFAHTPLCDQNDLEYLKDNGIIVTEEIKEADVLISQNYKHLKRHFWRVVRNKRFLLWTLEPRFDTSFSSRKKSFFGAVVCHIMNIYTEDVFTSGLTFTVQDINKLLNPLPAHFRLKNRKVVALMSFFAGDRTEPLIRENQNIDLIRLRTEIAMEGDRKNILDIYGKGWPDNMARENSRDGNWKGRKSEILNNYSFNLCFENTVARNYITEKIWDSIENYCLPIYYGRGNNIYEIFPENSFLDYSFFENPKELFDYIENMTDSEYIERLNKCISVYNQISCKGKDFILEKRKEMLDRLVAKLKQITFDGKN